MISISAMLMVPMLLVILAGCGDTAGPDGRGNMLASSGFDVEAEVATDSQGDSAASAWVGRSPGVYHYGKEMGDGTMGFLMLYKCRCSCGKEPVAYVTQNLRRPIIAGRVYDVSFSGTLAVALSWCRLLSTYERVPVRFVAYNGTPPKHPHDWREKPGEMAVIGEVDVTAATWHQYRTPVRWRADRGYASFAIFMGDSLIPVTPLPLRSDSLVILRDYAVFIDNVALWEAHDRMPRNSLFE